MKLDERSNLVIRDQNEAEQSSSPITLGAIARLFIIGVLKGDIRYDPRLVAERWLLADGSPPLKLIYNAARKDRGRSIAA